MFRAALTSLSCSVPHSAQIHSLIPSPALPFGLLTEILPQHEQAWVVYASLTSSNTTDRAIALYFSWVFSMNQPASKTLFAIVVLAKAELLTLPTTMNSFSHTRLVVNFCSASLRLFLILAWIAFTRFSVWHVGQCLALLRGSGRNF